MSFVNIMDRGFCIFSKNKALFKNKHYGQENCYVVKLQLESI